MIVKMSSNHMPKRLAPYCVRSEFCLNLEKLSQKIDLSFTINIISLTELCKHLKFQSIKIGYELSSYFICWFTRLVSLNFSNIASVIYWIIIRLEPRSVLCYHHISIVLNSLIIIHPVAAAWQGVSSCILASHLIYFLYKANRFHTSAHKAADPEDNLFKLDFVFSILSLCTIERGNHWRNANDPGQNKLWIGYTPPCGPGTYPWSSA